MPSGQASKSSLVIVPPKQVEKTQPSQAVGHKKASDPKTTKPIVHDLNNLIPKSIDEEEIMLKKALELSLKETNETAPKQYVCSLFKIVLDFETKQIC
jgi:hypothetical protein